MVILDSAGRPLYTNRSFQTMLGRSDVELRESNIFDYVHADDRSEVRSQFDALAGTDSRHFRFTGRYYRSDGSNGWWRLDVSHVISSEHSPFIFMFTEDVTEQKADSEKLKKAKEYAERATRTKSAFLANMSHEIRTPIHTITGMTELMLETRLDDEQREYALQVRFAAEVLLGLINDILDFSKIEAGKLSLETIEFDLFTMIEDAVDMVSLEAHKKGLEVILFLDPNLPDVVMGDPMRIRQIIVNLFNNAVKFTAAGDIVIRVEPMKRQNGTSTILFEVVDSGIGIPQEKLTKLFHAFTQVDSSTTRKFGGTGLGLSICKSLVRQMNGTIGVKSQEGRGSTFWFMVPFSARFLTEVDTEVHSRRQLRPFGPEVSLLVVDDNEMFQRHTMRYLKSWLTRVEFAADGPTALQMLHRASEAGTPYDVALVDLILPGMDGWQLASEVNADKKINSTRLVLMSPTGKASGEAKMKLLGWFNAYLTKPLKLRELYDALNTAVTGTIDLDSPDEEARALEELPAEPLPSEEGHGAGSNRTAGNGPDGHAAHSSQTILVAEDNVVNQQLFKTILERKGYLVRVAANGKQAVDAVESDHIDLVFMDVQMPEMNGYEAATEIRRRGHDVPIVAVTANALKGERERCLELGMNDYLTKPFKNRDVTPILERWLSDTRQPRAARPHEGRPAAASGTPSTENGERAPIFDYLAAVDAFMGKKEIVRKVVNEFIKRVGAQLAEIEGYINGGDFENAGIEAHGIKGGSWNLEARALGDAAANLEQSAREADETAARRDLGNLRQRFTEFCDYCAGLEELRAETVR